MYLFERGTWEVRSESPEKRAAEEAQLKQALGKDYAQQRYGPEVDAEGKLWKGEDRVEVTPTDAHGVYSFNDICIDVRGSWMEEKRGLITFLFLSFAIGLNGYLGYVMGFFPLTLLTRSLNGSDEAMTAEGYVFIPLSVVTWLVANYFLWKYAWRLFRLELFTQRHIIARFNRKTRQVYLNRPKYAGGLVVLPWDATIAAIDPDAPDSQVIGECLALAWPQEFNPGIGYEEMAFVGQPMDGNREVLGFWEFIRRYMEEGPDAVPRPKRLRPLFPWPWNSVRATLNFMGPVLRRGGKPYALAVGLLLSPLMALHALCHWISLLLCWPTRWPREIAEAGLPGKPVPKLTTAEDYGPEIAHNLRHNAETDRRNIEARERRRQPGSAQA